MKKRFCVLILLLFIALTLPMLASAETRSGSCGAYLTWTLDDDGMLTISGTGAMNNYDDANPNPRGENVKQVMISQGVTSIGRFAFCDCTGLTGVTIPASVTSIGEDAFDGCSSLASVTIPETVAYIGDAAFTPCAKLTMIDVAPGNSSFSSVNGVLMNKEKTTIIQCPAGVTGAYVIPAGVTRIADYAFFGCSGLTGVTIPDSVTSIGEWAFSDCSGLTGVTIPDSVTDIGEWAFSDCGGLTSVTIPGSVTSIGKSAFSDCSGLKSVIIPASVTSIDSSVFRCCLGLTSVTIPDSVTRIGSFAFENCLGLKSVIIPASVTSIDSYAFSCCFNLTSVTIPASVTSIGEDAFSHCGKDLTINCYTGSAAQEYALSDGFGLVLLDAAPAEEKPVITAQPASVTVKNGTTVSFKVTATGATSYQWYYRNSSSEEWTAIAKKGTSSSFTMSGLTKYSGRQYRCEVKNEFGSVYSNVATLTVK